MGERERERERIRRIGKEKKKKIKMKTLRNKENKDTNIVKKKIFLELKKTR